MNNKKEDEIYCPECGKAIKRRAIICPYCGVQVKELKTSIKKEDQKLKFPAKNKSIAIILSVFFSFWSWLYTYKKNYIKFWISFGITLIIITIIPIVIIIDISLSSVIFAEIFAKYGVLIWLFWLIYNGGIWLWALLDNAARPASFYENYPND